MDRGERSAEFIPRVSKISGTCGLKSALRVRGAMREFGRGILAPALSSSGVERKNAGATFAAFFEHYWMILDLF